MKGYLTFPIDPELESHHQMAECHTLDLSGGWGFTPLQRCSQCILQPKQIGQECHTLDLSGGWGFTPLQRCSQCILQPKQTGQE